MQDTEEFYERLDIDSAIQGLWRIEAISKYNAKIGDYELTRADRSIFCRAFATKLKLANGNEMVPEQIISGPFIDLDKPQNMIRFSNGQMWLIIQMDWNLIRVDTEWQWGNSAENTRPLTRLLFTVER
jgi:hypothetical protein